MRIPFKCLLLLLSFSIFCSIQSKELGRRRLPVKSIFLRNARQSPQVPSLYSAPKPEVPALYSAPKPEIPALYSAPSAKSPTSDEENHLEFESGTTEGSAITQQTTELPESDEGLEGVSEDYSQGATASATGGPTEDPSLNDLNTEAPEPQGLYGAPAMITHSSPRPLDQQQIENTPFQHQIQIHVVPPHLNQPQAKENEIGEEYGIGHSGQGYLPPLPEPVAIRSFGQPQGQVEHRGYENNEVLEEVQGQNKYLPPRNYERGQETPQFGVQSRANQREHTQEHQFQQNERSQPQGFEVGGQSQPQGYQSQRSQEYPQTFESDQRAQPQQGYEEGERLQPQIQSQGHQSQPQRSQQQPQTFGSQRAQPQGYETQGSADPRAYEAQRSGGLEGYESQRSIEPQGYETQRSGEPQAQGYEGQRSQPQAYEGEGSQPQVYQPQRSQPQNFQPEVQEIKNANFEERRNEGERSSQPGNQYGSPQQFNVLDEAQRAPSWTPTQPQGYTPREPQRPLQGYSSSQQKQLDQQPAHTQAQPNEQPYHQPGQEIAKGPQGTRMSEEGRFSLQEVSGRYLPPQGVGSSRGAGVSNTLDSRPEELEGLNGNIVDAALLQRVQQIIEDHERQQKALFKNIKGDNEGAFSSSAPESGGYPAGPSAPVPQSQQTFNPLEPQHQGPQQNYGPPQNRQDFTQQQIYSDVGKNLEGERLSQSAQRDQEQQPQGPRDASDNGVEVEYQKAVLSTHFTQTEPETREYLPPAGSPPPQPQRIQPEPLPQHPFQPQNNFPSRQSPQGVEGYSRDVQVGAGFLVGGPSVAPSHPFLINPNNQGSFSFPGSQAQISAPFLGDNSVALSNRKELREEPRPVYGVPLAPVIGLDSNENLRVVSTESEPHPQAQYGNGVSNTVSLPVHEFSPHPQQIGGDEQRTLFGGFENPPSTINGNFYGRNRRRVGIVTRISG